MPPAHDSPDADEMGVAVLPAEQQIHNALEVADRAYVMSRGGMVLPGAATDLRIETRHPEAAHLGNGGLFTVQYDEEH